MLVIGPAGVALEDWFDEDAPVTARQPTSGMANDELPHRQTQDLERPLTSSPVLHGRPVAAPLGQAAVVPGRAPVVPVTWADCLLSPGWCL
jgi:hypothetical protein